MKKKDIISIPNLLSFFRIILIPFIIVSLLNATTSREYQITAWLVVLSGFTDLLDGKIARKFNMITEFGKILDPIADKLTLGALLLCLAFKYQMIIPIAILYLVKEAFMGIMGLLLLNRNGSKLDGAKWFGKVCTAFLYFSVFLFLIFPDMSNIFFISLVVLCVIFILFAFISYLPLFQKMWKQERKI